MEEAGEAVGGGHVLFDLGEEGFWGGEALFVAETVEEAEVEGGGFGEVDGMEVEQVGLDGEGVCAEGGAVTDVGDGVEGLGGDVCCRFRRGAAGRGWHGGADVEAGDVDAVRGDELGVGGEVDGGYGVAGAVAAAGSGCAADAEGAVEEAVRGGDVTGGEEGADAAGGDGGSVKALRGVAGNGAAEVGAEGLEGVDAGLGAVAEAEVFTLVEFDDVELAVEEIVGELAGAHAGEVAVEGQDDDVVDAGAGEEVEFVLEGGDEGGAGAGADGAGGVGVEGDDERAEAKGAGATEDVADDPAMAAMDAVEVADGGDGGRERGRELVEVAVDVHQAIRNWSWRPS